MREQIIAEAKRDWEERMNRLGITDMSVEDFANQTIADIDAEGWDEDIHGDITLAMEAWARDEWDGTPWE